MDSYGRSQYLKSREAAIRKVSRLGMYPVLNSMLEFKFGKIHIWKAKHLSAAVWVSIGAGFNAEHLSYCCGSTLASNRLDRHHVFNTGPLAHGHLVWHFASLSWPLVLGFP